MDLNMREDGGKIMMQSSRMLLNRLRSEALSLPVYGSLPEIREKLRSSESLLISAEPGAGKSTLVPLGLLGEPWLGEGGKIIMLEPRRIAARAAAERMSYLIGEKTGETVGFRTGMETLVSARTRIEVVTEAVLTRMIQSDPELPGVGCVLFDEFHERSIHADLGLALALDLRSAFRPDLRLVVMSATLDSAHLPELLGGAAHLSVPGRCFDVRVVYSGDFRRKPLEEQMALTIPNALKAFPGDLLAFLPGEFEIRRACALLSGKAGMENVLLLPLYGNLPAEEQDRALRPDPQGRRRVILSTSIAESSITVDGVRIVVDGGLTRVPRFSPKNAMNFLETVPVSLASAEQRRGRAGRTAEGVCIRLWTPAEEASFPAHRAPEILEADFAPVMLELLKWGLNEETASSLCWLDFPSPSRVRQAYSLLCDLGAVSERGAGRRTGGLLSKHGERMLSLPLHPRLAHMILESERFGLSEEASAFAAMLSERDFLRNASASLEERYFALTSPPPSADRAAWERVRKLYRRIRSFSVPGGGEKGGVKSRIPENGGGRSRGFPGAVEWGVILALAYPDRIARRIVPGGREYLLANGSPAFLPAGDPLLSEEFLAVAETGGTASSSGGTRIFLALPLSRAALDTHLAFLTEERIVTEWDGEKESLRCFRVRTLGSLTLERTSVEKTQVPEETLLGAFLDAVRRRGLSLLSFTPSERSFLDRVNFLHRFYPEEYPDCSEAGLLASLEDWLGPFVRGISRLDDWKRMKNRDQVLGSLLPRSALLRLNALAPERVELPTGSKIRVDYSNPEQPVLSVRLQEVFGLADAPRLAGGRVPLMMDLLSPAMRTVQKTSDLKGFWSGSYHLVRKEMRGRYPKHDWPEDPLNAPPVRGVRRRPSSTSPSSSRQGR